MTNCEKIKTMTAEEMADFLTRFCSFIDETHCFDCYLQHTCEQWGITCNSAIKEWLDKETNGNKIEW